MRQELVMLTHSVKSLEKNGVDAKKIIAKKLAQLIDLFCVSEKPKVEHLLLAAKMVLETHPYFTLTEADFDNIAKNVIIGKYGRVYNRIDLPIIFEWLTAYLNEKAMNAEAEQLRRHKKFICQTENSGFVLPEGAFKTLADLIHQPSDKNLFEFSRYGSEVVEKVKRQFDTLSKSDKYGKVVNGHHFVVINNRPMSFNDYLNYKLNKKKYGTRKN